MYGRTLVDSSLRGQGFGSDIIATIVECALPKVMGLLQESHPIQLKNSNDYTRKSRQRHQKANETPVHEKVPKPNPRVKELQLKMNMMM